jgi:hypothetical protein
MVKRTADGTPCYTGAMDRSEEAGRIIEAIIADRFALRDHAIRRSDERLLSREHVIHAAKAPLSWRYQEEKFSHWFLGYLDESRTGGFAAVVDDGGEVRVLTVFKRRLSRREREAFPGYPAATSPPASPPDPSPTPK